MLKDPMHGNEHGNMMYIMKYTVRTIRDLEAALGLPAGFLVDRLRRRLLTICDNSKRQHTTLLTLGNQKLLQALKIIEDELRTKKKTRSQPVVDASDVTKAMLLMTYVLDGLAYPELNEFNSRQRRPSDKIADPFRPIIGAYNSFLHGYFMYRSRHLNVREIKRLEDKGAEILDTLQRVFPFFHKLKNGTQRSVWCTEKPHSIKHWGDTYATAGRAKNASTMVTETRMKSAVKIPAKKTNNHSDSFGKSILRNNMMMEAAMELSLHADRSG